MSRVQLTVLGSGDAFASGGRFQSCYAIEAPGRLILMETGPAILTALKRARFDLGAIDLVLISHMHGDHFAGLPFLILEYMYETARKRPLIIAGPRGLERRTWQMMRAMFRGFDIGPVSKHLKWVELKAQRTVGLMGMKIAAMRTPHTRPDISLALRITLAGKTIAFSGDSGWKDELVQFSAGADLFLCECTYLRPGRFKLHLDHETLKAHRAEFRVGRMILTHMGREVIHHRRRIRFETAYDGMRLTV